MKSNWQYLTGICLAVIFLGCEAEGPFGSPIVDDKPSERETKYRLELLGGDRQEYIGISPEPITFKIINTSDEYVMNDIYFNNSGLWIYAEAQQGNIYYSDDPAGNFALRTADPQCECFHLFWNIFPGDAPDINGDQVDSVVIKLNVYHLNSGQPVLNSPIQLVHYPSDS